MDRPDNETADHQSPAKRRRLSFGLRSLLALVFLVAVGAAIWAAFIAPRIKQRNYARLLRQLHVRGFETSGLKVSRLGSHQALTPDDVALLSRTPGLAALKLTGSDDQTLRGVSQLKQLQLLDLEFQPGGCAPFTEAGLIDLGDLPDLRALRIGDYSWTQGELSRLGQLKQLEFLALESWMRDSAFDTGPANWGGLTQLHTLDLERMRLLVNGLEELGRLPRLKSLTLRHCSDLSDDGMARIGELRELKELNFFWCQHLTDEGLRHIGQLKELESLSLVCEGASPQDFTAAGVRHLKGLSKLKQMCVYSPRLTGEMFVTVREMPHLSILIVGLSLPHSSPPKEVADWLNTVYPEKVLQALEESVAFEVENGSLEDFVIALSPKRAPIRVMFSELESAGRLPVSPITARRTEGVPLRQALEEVLAPRELDWVVSADGLGITITTKEAADKDGLHALTELQTKPGLQVMPVTTWWQYDEYAVREQFNEHTLDSFESGLWEQGGQ